MPRKVRNKRGLVEPYEVDPSEVPSESFVSQALQYISRPGWAMGSLLMGDTEQAGQHFGALFGGEAPELGPEFTDILKHHQIATPEKGTGFSLALNVLGGMAIDPTTYATLGVGGLAKGALVGASKKLATGSLSYALKNSPKFLAKQAASPSLKKEQIAEEIFKDTLQDTDYFKALSNSDQANILSRLRSNEWQSLDKDIWGSVIDSFQKSGDIKKSGMALRLELPFSQIGFDVPGTRALGQMMHKAIPFKDILDDAKRGVVSKFLDRSETTIRNIPQGMKYTARAMLQDSKKEATDIGEDVVKLFGPKGTSSWYNKASPTLAGDLARVGAPSLKEYRRLINNAVANERGTGASRVKWEMLNNAGVADVTALRSEEFLSLPEIIYSRKIRQNRSKWRDTFKEYAEKVDTLKSGVSEKDLVKYSQDIFEDIRPNKGMLTTLISGGRFTLSHKTPPLKKQGTTKGLPLPLRMAAFPIAPGIKIQKTKKGTDVIFPGFNNVWKSLVTSNITNLPYHIRNTISSIVMGTLNPDIGWSGLKAAFRLIPGTGKKARNTRVLHKALHADQNIAIEGLKEVNRLSSQGVKVGGMDIKEFLDIAKGALGGRVSHSAMDIVSETGEAFDLLNRKGQSIAHKAMFQWGENLANRVENFMRLTSLETLIKKGYEPSAALSAVQKQFVDYSLVSEWEKTLRDMIPFIKYQLGSLNWAKQVVSRPRQISWVGKMQQDQDILLESQKDPKSGETPTALGFPGMFRYDLGGGGLSTLEALGAAKDPLSLLEDAHPIYRKGLEYGFGKDLFTKQSVYADRRAPEWMPDWLVTKVTRTKDIELREINPVARSFIYGLSPFNRQLRMLDKLMEGKYLQPIFGIKEIEDLKKRADSIAINNLNKILKKKLRDGELKEFLQYISAYDKENTPPEIKQILKARRELFKQAKRRKLEEGREKR